MKRLHARRYRNALATLAIGLTLAGNPGVAADKATFDYATLTPETALSAARAALQNCRDAGFQVAVAVVDRGGNAQVMLRDRFAGPHTPETAIGKAWTAISFRSSTLALVELSQPGRPASGIRNLPKVVVLGGGIVIEAAGSIIGGLGVSGAPSGEADETCARAGLDAISEAIEF